MNRIARHIQKMQSTNYKHPTFFFQKCFIGTLTPTTTAYTNYYTPRTYIEEMAGIINRLEHEFIACTYPFWCSLVSIVHARLYWIYLVLHIYLKLYTTNSECPASRIFVHIWSKKFCSTMRKHSRTLNFVRGDLHYLVLRIHLPERWLDTEHKTYKYAFNVGNCVMHFRYLVLF